MDSFRNSLEHLLAEAKRVDLLLRREIIKMRQERGETAWDEYRGLLISEEEIECLISSPLLTETAADSGARHNPMVSRLDEAVRQLDTEVSHRKAASLRLGTELRLEQLRGIFGLSPFEADVILVGLLPELDLKYQRLFAYLQDDVTKKAPTVDMMLRLLAPPLSGQVEARASFWTSATMARHMLVSVDDPPSVRQAPLLEKHVRVHQRIVEYLLGQDQIESQIGPFVSLARPQIKLADVLLPPKVREHVTHILGVGFPDQGMAILLQGPYGAGKRMLAEALCGEFGATLLVVDVAAMLNADLPAETMAAAVVREVRLQNAWLYWHRFDLLLANDRNLEAYRRAILAAAEDSKCLTLFGCEAPWEPAPGSLSSRITKIDLPVPPFYIRQKLWLENLDRGLPIAPDVDVDALAGRFRFTGGQIRDAVAAARSPSAGGRYNQQPLGMDDLCGACRAQSNQKLTALARKVQPKFTWEDIVLPPDQRAQLREITDYVKYGPMVFTVWNFEQKVSLGRGLNALFAGPSGTGKTMAAEIIAGELQLDLYKIDLSTVVSKYIGETEKNLDRIFKEAHDSSAILFFDEADAIFGKRSEVRDSHDRYANIEIAYLLQKMEEYEGIVILATNLRKNLDEAFARRIHFSVEFPPPDEADRRQIWLRIFPREAPLSKDADLGFIARQFKVTGGNIKNIALGAAFLAAADGGVITTEHLIKATKREYQKMGKMCTEGEFARYFDLVRT